MTGTSALRAMLTELTGFAAGQEQALLVAGPAVETGDRERWAAAPLIAHNTEFRREQVLRLGAIRCGSEPPEFPVADHRSQQLYVALSAQPRDIVAADSWRITGELITEIAAAADADLLEPSRHAWLRGRSLWLQIVVRGFWHPCGHLGEYYLGRGQAGQAVRLAEQAVQTAAFAEAPAAARGMASYNLACALAGAGRLDDAGTVLDEAVSLNPELRENAATDADLAALRSG